MSRNWLNSICDFRAKAGLIGYAQVCGKSNSCPYNKIQMDLMYIANTSIIEDLKIIFATIKISFSKDCSEGIVNGSITAMHSSAIKQQETKILDNSKEGMIKRSTAWSIEET